MTASPEADLRAALDSAARSTFLTLDTAAVLEQGHRAVRRRRLRQAGVAALAVVAVAVGVVGSQRGSDGAIPATPSPGPATTLQVFLQSEGLGVPTTDVTVTVTYDAARRTGAFIVSRANGSRTTAEVTLDRNLGAGFTLTGAGTDQAVLYMLQPDTMEVRPLPTPRFHPGQWSADGNVADTDLVALVRSLGKEDRGPQTLYRTDPERGAVFGDGSQVDSARVSLGEATTTIWLNPSHRVWGYAEVVDAQPTAAGYSELIDPIDADFLRLEGTSGAQDEEGMSTWTTIVMGLLPAGATQVKPNFRATQPKALTFGSAVMSNDGRVALAARCTATAAEESSSEDLCRELKGVSWVDHAGTMHFTPLN